MGEPNKTINFWEALRFWLKLGFISFGGPAGQIAIMHKELVDRRKWIGEERFLHALNYCMLLPGPEAQQLAIYIGWLMHRTIGGVIAGVFFVLPSVFILLALSYAYAAFGHIWVVSGVLSGFKPVVVAIVVEALFKIGRRALKRQVHHGIAGLAFVAIFFFQVPFPLLVLAAALIGLIGTWIAPASFAAADAAPAADNALPDVEPVHHAGLRIARLVCIGLALWIVPLAVLYTWLGNGVHMQEYRFFTVSAIVTFGGAYAVLAYVTQATTSAPYNWITPTQAIDGLALAETTPGPLIMVLQFIGFMAGWNNPPSGMSPLISGVIGALVATYATFLPSFLFIFLGAPYIEKLRGNRSLSGALSGVTAAVVGVILNLALVFGAAVIFPNGYTSAPDPFALVLSVAAFAAMFALKLDVLWVILAGGAVGMLYAIITN